MKGSITMQSFARRCVTVMVLSGAMLSAGGQTAVTAATGSSVSRADSVSLPAVQASLAPGARGMSGQFFGYNLSDGFFGVWKKTPSLVSQLATMAPGTLRYPGGSIANYWDWTSGRADKESGRHQYPFSLQDLKQLVTASGAIPIFDLNIMTASLQSQVAMLRAAQHLGLPVRFIELGNEFYLSKPNYLHSFPTALSYGKRVAAWMPTLHKDFPSAQIAAVGFAQSLSSNYVTSRESNWNATVLKTVPELKDMTMHLYWRPNGARVAAQLAGPFQSWTQVQQDSLSKLPSNTRIWVTEYNMAHTETIDGKVTFLPPQGTWTQGLFVGTMDLLMLRDPRIQLADYYALVESFGDFGAIIPPSGQLRPSGTVQQLIARAAAGMAFSEPLTFARGPMLLGKYPGLVGSVFWNAAGATRVVVLNLSNRAVSMVLPPILSHEMVQKEIHGAPSATKADELQTTQVRTNNRVTLHPYSVTYLRSLMYSRWKRFDVELFSKRLMAPTQKPFACLVWYGPATLAPSTIPLDNALPSAPQWPLGWDGKRRAAGRLDTRPTG